MRASNGRRLHDPKPPSFLPLPFAPRTTTPRPPPPSSPPHAIPPLNFRYLSTCPRWSSWVAAALRDPVFAPILASSAISGAVAASTAAVSPDRAALSALLSLWDPGTHAFRLPAGPATFTLEDALVLAGLPPAGAPLDRTLTPEEDDLRVRLVVEREKIKELHPCARAARRVSAEVWLEWFDGGGIRPGEDDELRRLGFLAYWLAFFVTPRLRSRGGELPVRVFALAARLSLGERIALGQSMVANLYAEMDKIVASAVDSGVCGRLDVYVPLWMLQVWMWERYKRLCPPELKAPQFPISNVRVLHWSRRKKTSTSEEVLKILLDEVCFEWKPYRYNSLNWMDPKWFNMHTILVTCHDKDKPEWLLDYIAVISQTMLTGFHSDDTDNSVLYNPQLVARQFGYDQAAPVSIAREIYFVGTELWIPSISRYGMPGEDYVAWCSSGRFYKHQDDDQYGCSVVRDHENGATSSQLNVSEKCDAVPALDQFLTQVTKRDQINYIVEEQLGIMDNGSHENETKVIVCGLATCVKDSRTTSVKRKEKKQRDKFAEDGGNNKKKSKVEINTKRSPLQLEGQKYSSLQEDLNSDSKKCDELAQVDSDDECIVLEQPKNKCEVINLDDDDEEQSAPNPEHHNMQLVLELEEYVRSGLLSQWEESSDEDDVSGSKRETLKKSNNDPYAEAAMREYPLFFEFIPQKPHYRGFVNYDETLGDLPYSGLWFLLIGLAKEVLRTSCDTDASEITYLMKKAQHLEQLGFNVKHLIARLKEPQIRLRKLQDSRARLEHAREEEEGNVVESLSSHLNKLKGNIKTMERHLDGKKQAFISNVHDKLNEGINLVSLENEVETAEKYCQAMKDEVAAMRMRYSDSGV
ncbi:unnamed protein product [Miscanthus lutarioriparius]|uniref:Aminotransferase-like plant mobile domain-containing protein n=1 Tax=Miscanthus lutarioriparius TaxID=422564 RepID=A0A811M6Z3_9POAL|nr:unnamed protein product [Miscanthus lutarioriparius]